MEDKKIVHVIGISLVYEIYRDSEKRRVALAGFGTDGHCFDIDDYELACEAARAAEAVWNGAVLADLSKTDSRS